MEYLRNTKEIDLLTWETDSSKRNLNNDITAVIPNKKTIEVGNIIIGNMTGEKASCYEVIEIIKTRPAALSKRTHLTLKIKWNSRSSLPIIKHFEELELIS